MEWALTPIRLVGYSHKISATIAQHILQAGHHFRQRVNSWVSVYFFPLLIVVGFSDACNLEKLQHIIMSSRENNRIQKQVIDSDFERVINTLKEDMNWKFDLELNSRTMKERMFRMRNCSMVAVRHIRKQCVNYWDIVHYEKEAGSCILGNGEKKGSIAVAMECRYVSNEGMSECHIEPLFSMP